MASTKEATTVCCPGKVLLAGGYLVLESPNPGIVLAADGEGGSSRFFATVSSRRPADAHDAALLSLGADNGTTSSGPGPSEEGRGRIPLDVHSPQFDAVFRYWLDYVTAEQASDGGNNDSDSAVQLPLLSLSPRHPELHSPNPYVERTLSLTLAYVQHTLGYTQFATLLTTLTSSDDGTDDKTNKNEVLSVKLRAGNDFYSPLTHLKSRSLKATPGNVASLPQFLPCPKVQDEETGMEKVVVNKTGMGSSAALVTSLVGAVLSYFGLVTLPKLGGGDDNGDRGNQEDEGQRISHNLAQICHCSAQGKVGSGFDVSAAVHGTHVYRRFSKSVLANLLEDIDSSNNNSPEAADGASTVTAEVVKDLAAIVSDANRTTWDAQVVPIDLPPGLEILMADVCGGSESPSMARKVLAWKKKLEEDEEGGGDSDSYWERLKRTNAALEKLFRADFVDGAVQDGLVKFGPSRLAQLNSDGWANLCGNKEGDDDDALLRRAATALLDARVLFQTARADLKAMGDAAAVPIEPDGQTSLADATMALPGVVAAGVPGAGGYDALFALYVRGTDVDGGKSDEVRERIGDLWRAWADSGGASDGVEVVCPLAVRGAGNGGNFGLCESDLGW